MFISKPKLFYPSVHKAVAFRCALESFILPANCLVFGAVNEKGCHQVSSSQNTPTPTHDTPGRETRSSPEIARQKNFLEHITGDLCLPHKNSSTDISLFSLTCRLFTSIARDVMGCRGWFCRLKHGRRTCRKPRGLSGNSRRPGFRSSGWT